MELKCLDETDECSDLGIRASGSVASSYCLKKPPVLKGTLSLFPEFCVTHAIDHCRANFLND